ncbi:hypothetical protein, partial [Aneurinibacillus migulanus]|uniref:hypothetical protein n=1 Tax=Aneurinibacillus migulanus TaxID=47500 RepID=UPI001C474B95
YIRKSFLSDILFVVVTSLYQKERFSFFLREKGCPKVTFGTPSSSTCIISSHIPQNDLVPRDYKTAL